MVLFCACTSNFFYLPLLRENNPTLMKPNTVTSEEKCATTLPLRIKLHRTTPIGGDETAAYDVELSRPCSVREFVDFIIKAKASWGVIVISRPEPTLTFAPLSARIVEYKYGAIIHAGDLCEELYPLCIESVTMSGGWGHSDYYIKTR